MKLIILCSLLFISCVQEKETKQTKVSASSSLSKAKVDDFSDLEKKDDEGCDTKEDLEKKIMEEAKKKPEKAFQLQGGDPGCSTN
jgi:hypothetical protein